MSGKVIHKHIILNFVRALNKADEKADILPLFTTDEQLTERFLQMEALLPHFQILVDELTAENQRVILKARLISDPSARGNDDLFSGQIPFVMGFFLNREKIINAWMITDLTGMLNKLDTPAPKLIKKP